MTVYCLMARCEENGVKFEELITILKTKEDADEVVNNFNKLLKDHNAKFGQNRVIEYFIREKDVEE